MKWVRVAAGDYETPDGRYRAYRCVGVNPPGWNVEAVWTDEEYEQGVDIQVSSKLSELVIDGAASLRDAKALFEDAVGEYDVVRRLGA